MNIENGKIEFKRELADSIEKMLYPSSILLAEKYTSVLIMMGLLLV